MLSLHVVGSGSKGNCSILVDSDTSRSILIDCGICKRDVMNTLKESGASPDSVDAILITHSHNDHVKCLGVVTRAFKHSFKVYAPEEVAFDCASLKEISPEIEVVPFSTSGAFHIGPFLVRAFATSHDSGQSAGFRIETIDDSIGYATDTGFLDEGAMEALSGVRILALESNHDLQMLMGGDYPRLLKERISSDLGHLSNAQAHDALRRLSHPGLEHVVCMHLSENNNLKLLARESAEGALAEAGCGASVTVASQTLPCSVS